MKFTLFLGLFAAAFCFTLTLIHRGATREMTLRERQALRAAQGGPGGTGWTGDSICGILASCQAPFNVHGCDLQDPCDNVIVSGATDEDRVCSPNPNPFFCECREGDSVWCATFYNCEVDENGDCVVIDSSDNHAGEGCEDRCFPS